MLFLVLDQLFIKIIFKLIKDRPRLDPEIIAALHPWKEIVDREGLRVIGSTKVPLARTNCTITECNIGDFVADAFVFAMIDEVESDDWTYWPIAVIASGGIRTSLAKGNLTYADLVTCVPFKDTLDTIDILGEHLLSALEFSATKATDEDRYNILQISGEQILNYYDLLELIWNYLLYRYESSHRLDASH